MMLKRTALAMLCCTAWGCVDLGYLIPALIGQTDLVARSVPIEQAIAAGGLSADQTTKLVLIQDVRAFARDRLGLFVGDHYTMFFDAGQEAVAYNLSASRKDALQAYEWWFPVVGFIPYLGFFDPGAAQDRALGLEVDGYETYLYEVDAYNVGNWAPNPVLSPMLRRSEVDLVETVIHELLHSTIASYDVSFNESLATWVGRRGAMRYFVERRADPAEAEFALRTFEDADKLSEFMLAVVDELQDYYASPLDSAQKVAGRGAVYESARERFSRQVLPQMNFPQNYGWVQRIPTNNAYMLGFERYHTNLDLFDAVFEALGQDWDGAVAVFSEAAQGSSNPFDALRMWSTAGAERDRGAAHSAVPQRTATDRCPRNDRFTLLPHHVDPAEAGER